MTAQEWAERAPRTITADTLAQLEREALGNEPRTLSSIEGVVRDYATKAEVIERQYSGAGLVPLVEHQLRRAARHDSNSGWGIGSSFLLLLASIVGFAFFVGGRLPANNFREAYPELAANIATVSYVVAALAAIRLWVGLIRYPLARKLAIDVAAAVIAAIGLIVMGVTLQTVPGWERWTVLAAAGIVILSVASRFVQSSRARRGRAPAPSAEVVRFEPYRDRVYAAYDASRSKIVDLIAALDVQTVNEITKDRNRAYFILFNRKSSGNTLLEPTERGLGEWLLYAATEPLLGVSSAPQPLPAQPTS